MILCFRWLNTRLNARVRGILHLLKLKTFVTGHQLFVAVLVCLGIDAFATASAESLPLNIFRGGLCDVDHSVSTSDGGHSLDLDIEEIGHLVDCDDAPGSALEGAVIEVGNLVSPSSSFGDGTPRPPAQAGPLEASGQAVFLQENDESSGRLRGTVFYPVGDSLMLGAEADLVFGEAFGDGDVAIKLNELYATYAPVPAPEFRLVVGLIDLTSYFDRNSFAKDKTTHFFNSVFETNPALSAAGIGSKPGLLVNWSPVDAVELKAAGFSSSRALGDLALDAFAGEAGVRWQHLIVRGTYATARDAGNDSGFEEIFRFDRGNGRFGLRDDDREVAYGVNAELFLPNPQVGLFGRYGHYRNLELDQGGETYSFGLNWLDVAWAGDRLGLGYGRELSEGDRDSQRLDVLEAFYDFPVGARTRAAVSLQGREEFSETVFGFRVKAQF